MDVISSGTDVRRQVLFIQHKGTPLIWILINQTDLKRNKYFCNQHVNNEWWMSVCDHQF